MEWFCIASLVGINTAEACHNSGDKILMKQCFDTWGVKTAEWFKIADSGMFESLKWENERHIDSLIDDFGYNIIIKHKNSCKGIGIYLINSKENLVEFIEDRLNTIDNYIFEKYYNYSKEYRLHVTKDDCFYTCRKMLKEDAEERWHRHDMNSVWIMEEKLYLRNLVIGI